MTGKSKLVLALVAVTLLLWNPAGVCAGTPSSHGPSHPCCPPTAPHHSAGGSGTCVCIDRQPAGPALPSLDAGGPPAVAASDAIAPGIVFRDEPIVGYAEFSCTARFLTFHQILI